MKQKMLMDMDGVLADVYAQFSRLEYEETGLILDINTLAGKIESEAFPHYEKHVRSAGFFRNAPVIEGSVEGLKYLNDKYNILIVSSATEFPDSLKEKHEWLSEFFPFISWKQMIFCGTKDSVVGDIMVDDHPKNLDHFTGKRILFTQPHNKLICNNGYERADSWQQLITSL